MYPKNDKQFEEMIITKVEKEGNEYAITRSDGWVFNVKPPKDFVPKQGMEARFYGAGIGLPVRGLFIDSKKMFYRTEDEQKKFMQEELYGKNAEEWLKRWDSGSAVWSISMGGLGPGYEQAIQITVAEILRHLLEEKYDYTEWEDDERRKEDGDKICETVFKNKVVEKLGLSGAQYGAALHLAVNLYREGPIEVMNTQAVKDRHIQVSKNFLEG